MKARNREINIFNMSLLDILCGALGAFCFMMLSLLPYYRPPGEDYKKVSQEQQKLLEDVKDIKDLMERLKHTTDVEDLRELVEQLQQRINELENRIKELQGQVNYLLAENADLKKKLQSLQEQVDQLKAQNQQLAQQNDQLKARNQQLEQERQQLMARNEQLEKDNQRLEYQNEQRRRALEQRVPWLLVLTPAIPSQRIYASLHETVMKFADGSTRAPFHPNVASLEQQLVGEKQFSQGSTFYHLLPQRAIGSVQKFYVRLLNDPSARAPTTVSGVAVGQAMEGIELPGVELTPERPWVFVGTFSVPALNVVKFTPASQQERDAEWERIMNAKPPKEEPQTPAKGLSRKESEDMARRARETKSKAPAMDAAGTQRMRDFSLAMTAAKTDAEKRKLVDEALGRATSAQERAQIQYISAKLLQPAASPGPGAGPAVPFGVQPGPAPAPPAPKSDGKK